MGVLLEHISYNKRGGIVVRKSEVRNIQAGASDIEANQNRDGPPAANVLFDAGEDSILEDAITGRTVQHGHEALVPSISAFRGRGPSDPNKAGNFVIANNALSDMAVNIHLQHARGVVVNGATFWRGYEHHLLAEGSSNIVLGPPACTSIGPAIRACAHTTALPPVPIGGYHHSRRWRKGHSDRGKRGRADQRREYRRRREKPGIGAGR